MLMKVQARAWSAAVFLLCICILFVSVVVADEESSLVCTADDAREECMATSFDEENTVDNNPSCVDTHESCRTWANDGECQKNPNYMLSSCRRSCKVCGILDDNDFGEPQQIPHDEVKKIVQESTEYMKQIGEDETYADVRNKCLNKHQDCSLWALGTGCDDNPSYMKQNCAPACQSCDYVLRMHTKCKPDPNAEHAIENGEMDSLFETIIEGAMKSGYEPKVWSRPMKSLNNDNLKQCEEDVFNPCDALEGPWVVTLENFISASEITNLKEWGAKLGYERSQAGDQIIDVRTSSHAWCTHQCYTDPVVTALRSRIHDITQIPEVNSEYLQLLKYTEGQFYKPHNDFIVKHVNQAHGPRLLTFFMYFNEVEEGGGTRFPKLNNLTIDPKEGRVLIWPSVLDENTLAQDYRTDHEALAVTKGEKYAANAWLHLRDFMTGFKMGCDS